jgi:hypothetical protein
MIDGVHFGEHCCVVALGIGIDGMKHPLSLVEGSTENTTLVTDLIVGLRERGLDVTRPILAVLDGAKALRRAVLDRPSDRSLSTAQDPQRSRSATGEAALGRSVPDAPGHRSARSRSGVRAAARHHRR